MVGDRLEFLRYVPRIFIKRRSYPFYILFFVTHSCTARCDHCLLGDREDRRKFELNIDEIEKISRGLRHILFMFLTGGEPFLREDLDEIAYIFVKNNKVQKFQIPSNGSLTDQTIATVERMIKKCPNTHIGVTISLDALGEDHDKIRHFEGLFNRATTTFRRLRELEKKYPNFNPNVTITVSCFNQDKLIPLYHFIKNELGARNIFNTLIRGKPRNPLALAVDVRKFAELSDLIDRDLAKAKFPGYARFPFASFVNAKNLMSRKLIARIATERRYFIPCYAGQISMVLFSEGKIAPCEILDENFGNIREFNYDFHALWTSKKADEIRRKIRMEKCFCTHECFITHNILFNPLMLPRLFWNCSKTMVNKFLSS